MQTVGQLLKKTREEKGQTLESVEKSTKIRLKYLQALEKDDYRVLPSAIAARGFIKNYGQLLGLSNETLQALFRRDFVETEAGQVIPRGMVKPLNNPDVFSWTPKKTAILAVSLIALVLCGYFLRQILILNSSPKLELTQPSPNATIGIHDLVVKGQTDPDVAVSVNGQLAQVDKEGAFQTGLFLPSGQNIITVVATSKSNKSTKLTRTVLVK